MRDRGKRESQGKVGNIDINPRTLSTNKKWTMPGQELWDMWDDREREGHWDSVEGGGVEHQIGGIQEYL